MLQLAHENLLPLLITADSLPARFLESGLETALILEDDVDWDIRLRSVQIPLQQVPFASSCHLPDHGIFSEACLATMNSTGVTTMPGICSTWVTAAITLTCWIQMV